MEAAKAPSPCECPHSSGDYGLSLAPSSNCLILLEAPAQNSGPVNSCPIWLGGFMLNWDLESSHLQISPVAGPGLNNDQTLVFAVSIPPHQLLELPPPAS